MNQYKSIFTVYFLIWLVLALAPLAYALVTMDGLEMLERSLGTAWRSLTRSGIR